MIYFATAQYCAALKYIGHDSQQKAAMEFDHVVISQGIIVTTLRMASKQLGLFHKKF